MEKGALARKNEKFLSVFSAVEAIRSVDRASPIELFSHKATPLFSRVLLSY